MIILYIIIVFTSTYIGYLIYKKLLNKVNYYKSLILFLESYKRNVSFSQDSLSEFILKFDCQSTLFKETLLGYLTRIKEDKKNIIFPDFISNYEEQELTLLFDALGKTDELGQVSLAENGKVKFEECLATYQEKFNKNGTVSIKLGFLLGLLLVILLI